MLQKIKKRTAQVALIAIVLVAVFFVNVRSPGQLKSYLLNENEQLWGQAYSPNIGWINFYCDGLGNTIPATAPPGKGASAMPNFCSTVPYGVTFDSSTLTFSGEAYSSNYGWLDLNGLTMNDSFKVRGDTNGGTIGDYNFGTTYFQKNDPTNDNPGVDYYNNLGYLCGFAYSDAVGYISFCDPQTKADPPSSINGFDFDTYAVYLGIGDSDDPLPPILTTTSRVFAATDNYGSPIPETLWFQDDVTDIASVEVVILDSNGVEQTYNANYFDPGNNRASVDITSHDFHLVGNYDLTFTACDIVGNCTDPVVENSGLYSGFFTVVAAVTDWVGGNSYFEFGSPPKVADGQENHFVQTTLRDEYGNPVISVAGIKEVSVNTKFENTTKLDQISGTGDSAIFEASEFGFSQEGGTSTGYLIEANGDDGKFQVDVKSYAPTSNGYTPIEGDGFDLFFKEITYNVAALGGYANVGESSGTWGSSDEDRKFAFSPTLIITPEALIWDGAYYVLDTAAAENITVNAPKRFNLELQNFSSSIIAGSPELGLLVDASDVSITWTGATTEDPIEQNLNLDIDADDDFDSSWNAAGGLVSGGIVGASSVENIRMRTTPELDLAAAVPANFGTLFEAYAGYDVGVSGKHVRHKSESLEVGAAQLFNPGIEIIGSVYSSGGTSSKQTGAALNQSLGDTAQNELETLINRNTAALTKNSSVSACTDVGEIDNLTDFWSENPNCAYFENSVLYFEGDVVLNLSGNLPSGVKTILVEGGNLHIKNNFIYPATAGNSFGVIVLKNATGNGGNIFMYPDVINMAGAFYAEGSVISVNAGGECGEDATADCSSTGFCDRSFELRNQLHWKGLIATQNTIGGADDNPLIFPNKMDIAANCPPPSCASVPTPSCSREAARLYDFAYLRTYHPDSGGIQVFADSDAAFVAEYDSRVQSNPPPLFGLAGAGSSQLGN
ncbi:hypothetical protein KKF38_01795 [Patescibacteria group bacterium]|nr:hypothetical protein [Patescibacteria group bacterium]